MDYELHIKNMKNSFKIFNIFEVSFYILHFESEKLK